MEPSLGPADLVDRFVSRAHMAVREATLDDLLGFITVRGLAAGSAHQRFSEAFPDGRDALIAELQRRATVESDVAPDVAMDLLKLANALRDGDEGCGDRLRAIALDEFDAYADDDDMGNARRTNEILRGLMIAVAGSDATARELVAGRYAKTDGRYAERYEELLKALGRELVPDLGSTEDLALVMAAVLDGFLTRAAIEGHGRDAERVRELFARTVVPLLGALTYPRGALAPTDRDRLYHGLTPSATAEYVRTPPWSTPERNLERYTGIWRGTMHTQTVTRDTRPGNAPRETYLVVDATGEQLRVTNYIETGLSRMILPQVTIVNGRLRLACMYEAELYGNPTPDRPSHRGAWVLEGHCDEDAAPPQLIASYFNDRSARGEFVFTDHVLGVVAGTFGEARKTCRKHLGSDWRAADMPSGAQRELALG
jgi:hypothetical protein